MSKKRKDNNPFVVYTDALMLIVMTLFLIVSLLLLIPQAIQKKDADYHPKAEVMIVLDWDDQRNVDLDLWLKTPDGKLVFYKNKEALNINLDRDSRGKVSNLSQVEGNLYYTGNEEIITLRALLPGTYTVAVTYYNDNDGNSVDHNIDYTLKVTKINPTLKDVFATKGHLSEPKQLDKVVTFTIDSQGNVTVAPLDPESFLKEGEIP